MTDYTLTPLMPHGDIKQIFDDVFFVTGTSRPKFQGIEWQFSRNMTIVRHDGELTLINTVRLDEARLAELEQLGSVKNIVKIGAFHGIDDAFYHRRGAVQWALPGMKHEAGHATDQELTADNLPFPGCQLFTFETANKAEGILLLEREGGVLVSCDSLQNWDEVDQYFSEESGAQMTQYGFIKPANIGPGWLQNTQPQKSDFERLKALPFRHLISAHGRPILNDAHAQLSKTFADVMGVE